MLSVLVLVLFSSSAPAACCRVEGIVRSEVGAIVADAQVSLSAPDLKAPMLTTTTAEGRYQFDGVKPGSWAQVRVLVNGRPVAESVTLVTQPVETLNITISPASTSAASVEDLKPMGGVSGELRGIVRAADGTPLSGARVVIESVGIDSTTDSAGRYSFGHVRAPLTVPMTASAQGFSSVTRDVSVKAGASGDSDFSLKPESAAAAEPLGVAEAPRDRESLTLRASELATLPGLAPFDVFRAIELLPMTSLSDSSELVLHGMPPGDTLVTMDGIPWFPSRRLAGQIGAPLNTAFIQEVSAAAAPLGSSSGGSLAGLLDFSGRHTRQDRVAGTAEADFFGVSGSAAVPLGHVGSVSFGARHSFSSQLYGDVLDAFSGPDQHYVRDRVPVLPGAPSLQATPSFSDINGRVELDPGRGNRITASLYHGNDDGNFSRDIAAGPTTAIGVPPTVPLPSDATMQVGDAQTWTGQGGSVDWSRQWSSAISTDASFTQSKFTSARQRSFVLTSPSAGGNYNLIAGLGGSNGTNEANEIRDTDVRANVGIDAGFNHALQAGFEYTTLDSTYDAQTAALLHNPITGVAASQLVTLLNRQDTGHVTTVFGQDVWTPMATLTVSPGARLVHYDLASTTYVDPRVSASYVPGPGFVVKGTWSIDHQPAASITREDLQHGDMDFWTLADGSAIPIPRSREASAEATFERTGILIDARLYYRWLDNLSLFAPRLLPGAAPASPTSGLYVGTGTAAGFEFLVQQTKNRNSIWAGLTLGRVEYSFPGLESSTFLAPFDRRAQGRVADSFQVWRGLSATAVMFAGTGAPYTVATASEPVWFPNGDVAYQPRFEAKNAGLLPKYHHLDVSGQYDLHFGSTTASAGVTVFNVYDAKNIAYYDYEAAGPTLTTTETYLMRRAVNAFVRVRF